MAEETETEEGPRSFARFIMDLDDGCAHSELSGELQRLVTLLQQRAGSGKAKGKLVFELALEIEKGHVTAAYDVRLKEPQKKRAGDVFFVTDGCNLSRENTKQLALPVVREVPKPSSEAREAAPPKHQEAP